MIKMLNYNIQVNLITKDNEVIEMGRYRYDNPHNLTAITYTKLVYKYREYQKACDGYTEINLVEEVDGNIVKTKLYDNKPIPDKGTTKEQELVLYMYEVAGTLD
jgi:hypothetical protein